MEKTDVLEWGNRVDRTYESFMKIRWIEEDPQLLFLQTLQHYVEADCDMLVTFIFYIFEVNTTPVTFTVWQFLK